MTKVFDPLLYIKTWLCSSTGVTVHAAVCSVCDPQSGWLHALLSERTDGQVYAHLQGTQHYTSFACDKGEEVTVSMSGAVQCFTSLLSGQGENGLCVCCAPTHSCSIKEVTTLVLFLNADCHSVRHQLKVGRMCLWRPKGSFFFYQSSDPLKESFTTSQVMCLYEF